MSFQDRTYYRETTSYGSGGGNFRRTIGFGMPRPTPMVKYLLIINIVVFIFQSIFPHKLELLFAATGYPPIKCLEVWRLVTFQFLHGSISHILFNMLGVYFLGPTLEQSWGSRKFITFYLVSGAVGGALFLLGSNLNPQFFGGYLIGASGGVLAMLVACAILFPQFVVILLIFPVPIRFAAFLFTGLYLLNVLQGGPNAGGDLCHLGGMATGFIWVMGRSYFAGLSRKVSAGVWQRKQEKEQKLQYELDRLLAKVHEHGIHSLTRKEKQILQKATELKKKRPGY